MARDVLGFSGDMDCILEPLSEGLHFLSDAYFVNVKNESTEISLFVKVNLLVMNFFSSFPPLFEGSTRNKPGQAEAV